MASIKRFEDAEIWQDSINLSKKVYLVVQKFPANEQFGLTSQIKRAVNSVSANFAEGFGRFSTKNKHHFYTISYGSLLEVKNFLYLSVELGFCRRDDIINLIKDTETIQKQLNALMKALRS
jgi:four helix bundle protein